MKNYIEAALFGSVMASFSKYIFYQPYTINRYRKNYNNLQAYVNKKRVFSHFFSRLTRCRKEYSKWGLFDSTLLCCFGWTEDNESPCGPQTCNQEIYRTVVVTEPSRDPSEYDEAELEFMCQVDTQIFRNN